MYSIVTPVDLSRRSKELLDRVRVLAEFCAQTKTRLVIGHNDRFSEHDAALKRLEVQFHPFVRVVSIQGELVAGQSRLRNLAVEAVDTENLILLDADIYPDKELFDELNREVETRARPFSMSPCVYLTKQGTRFLQKTGDKQAVIDSYLRYSRFYVQHLAMPSSVIALTTKDYRDIGGFDVAYVGHGYEDFDFMLRLAFKYDLIDDRSQLLIDRPYRAPLLAEGFRAQLAKICLTRIFQNSYAFHLYHDKKNTEDYYLRREVNAKIFLEKMRGIAGAIDSSEFRVPPLIQSFFDECVRFELLPDKFYALFDARPGHLVKVKSYFKRIFYRAGRI